MVVKCSDVVLGLEALKLNGFGLGTCCLGLGLDSCIQQLGQVHKLGKQDNELLIVTIRLSTPSNAD